MDTKRICSICGKPLAPNAPEGLCPECLLKAGLGTGVDIGLDTGGKAPRFTPPKIEELAAKFPQLEILEFIGQGGMGAVYKARQKQLDRVVALKILPPQAGGPAFAERFTREARALAKLNHPHIVTLYEFGQSDGLFYFFMEFVDGVNLRQLLSNSRISPREALAIVPQICEALQFAHDSGIVHRDIKPENILLDKKGLVKIADFGVAKMIAESLTEDVEKSAPEASELTEAGSTLGTPQYMAPEQIKNPAEVDHRADIYSVGVVFYQMLTGELPSGKIEPPSRKVQIDVRLDEVVLRALEKKPEMRFQQASDVKTAVETIATTPQAPAPKTPPGFRHYKDSTWSFELDIPEDWKTLAPNHKNSPFEVLRFAPNAGRHLIIIFRTRSYNDASGWAQKIMAKAGFGNFVSAETTIGGKLARTLDFDRPEGNDTWSCRHYFIAEDTAAQALSLPFGARIPFTYTLGFGTTDKAGMFEIFDRIAKSFQFQPSGEEKPFKPFFPKTQTVAADEPKQEPGSQMEVPELGPEGYTARIEPVNPKAARRFGVGAVFAVLAILMSFIAIFLAIHKVSVNARMRAASQVNALFHVRVFEADAGLVDQLIPTGERQYGVPPNVQSALAQAINTSPHRNAWTDSQSAQVSPAVVHSLLRGIVGEAGLLVDQTRVVSGIWWQSGLGLAGGWSYSVAKNSLFGGGVCTDFLDVQRTNGVMEVRIGGELNHSVDNMIPARNSQLDLNSRFFYEGPLPQTNELAFLVPFFRHNGSEHYLVTVFDFNGENNQETLQGLPSVEPKLMPSKNISVNALFHYRVFEADAGLVDHLIPAGERRDGMQPNVRSTFGEPADSDSQLASVNPAVIHILLQGMAAKPGLLVDRTRLVSSSLRWPTGLLEVWNYLTTDTSLFGNGGGMVYFGIQRTNGVSEVRIDARTNHRMGAMNGNGWAALPPDKISRFLYDGPLPQTNELVFLEPFVRNDGWRLYLVTVFDFNGQTNEESPSPLNGPPFTAQLHQAAVELAFVGDEPWTNPVCWYPNGQPSPEAFPTGSTEFPNQDPGLNVKKLALYIRNQSTNGLSAPICRVDGDSRGLNGNSVWVAPNKFDPKGYFGQSLAVPANATVTNLSIGVANGPWETVVSLHRGARTISGSGTGGDDWVGTFESVMGTNGDVAVSCSYTTRPNWVSRVAYVNGNGDIIPIDETSCRDGNEPVRTGILLISSNEYSHIKKFLVQRRKFQWVRFENISLQHGHSTSVTANVY